jgi:hypothetical protein
VVLEKKLKKDRRESEERVEELSGRDGMEREMVCCVGGERERKRERGSESKRKQKK